MTRTRWIALIVAALVIGGAAAAWVTMGRGGNTTTDEWVPDASAEAEADDTGEWIPDAGDDDTTAMEAVAQPISGEAELLRGVPVDLTPELVQVLGVRTATVERRKLTKDIRAVGRFDYNEETLAVVTPRVSGRVERLGVSFTGARVRKGDELLSIYSPELVSAQREYLIALRGSRRPQTVPSSLASELGDARQALLESSRQRLELWGLTPAQIARIETDGVATYLPIYAPISGTVIQKNVLEGAYVGEGTPLFTIADLSSVWLYADIYESDVSWVKTGQPMEVHVAALTERRTLTGRIAFIDPFVDPRLRTTRVRAVFRNTDNSLRPGMYAHVNVKTPLGNVLAIPESAVIFSGKRNFVVVSDGKGRFQPRQVEVEALASGYYAALRGVSEGDTVVTAANFLIDSESNLRIAIEKMGSQNGDMPQATGAPQSHAH